MTSDGTSRTLRPPRRTLYRAGMRPPSDWPRLTTPPHVPPSSFLEQIGKGLTKKLKELLPRQQFKVPIQAAVGVKIIASEALSGEQARQ